MTATDAGIALLTMPRPDEWLRAETASPRRIELEDLLGRDAVQLDVKGLSELLSGQTVLVTDATYSPGIAFVQLGKALGLVEVSK